MEQFAPEAPNVWAGIETGIKNNAGSSNAGSGNAVAGSKMGMGILKVLAIASLPAALIAYSYFKNPNTENKQAAVTTQQEFKELQDVGNQTPAPMAVEPTQKETVSTKTTAVDNNSTNNKADKKIIAIQELANNKNNTEALKSQTNPLQDQDVNTNQSITKTEASPKPTNSQILQNELENESNLNEEIESVKTEEEVEKPKEEMAEVTIKEFPNSFSPNNDGMNDKYVIIIEGEKYYNLKIYNTRNELVFESNDKLNNWDGTNFKNGQVCGAGIYYGVLVYKGAEKGDVKTLNTIITLLRN